MKKAITIHDAKTNLSKYIAAAKNGEKIYIGSFGNAEVVMEAVVTPAKPKKRKFGIAKGEIWVAPDAFSRQTDDEIAALMYGETFEKYRGHSA